MLHTAQQHPCGAPAPAAPPPVSRQSPSPSTHDEEGTQQGGGRPGLCHPAGPIYCLALCRHAFHPVRQACRHQRNTLHLRTPWTESQHFSRFAPSTSGVHHPSMSSQTNIVPSSMPPVRASVVLVSGDLTSTLPATCSRICKLKNVQTRSASAGYSPLRQIRTNRNARLRRAASAGSTNAICGQGKIAEVKVKAPESGTYSIPSRAKLVVAPNAREHHRPRSPLADGLPQSVPDVDRQGDRRGLHRRRRPRRRRPPASTRGPSEARSSSARSPHKATTAGRTFHAPGEQQHRDHKRVGLRGERHRRQVPQLARAVRRTISFRNTGQQTLPPARAAWIRYAGDAGSRSVRQRLESPMAGPVYRYDASNPSTTKFPPALDGLFFAGEIRRGWIKPIAINSDGCAARSTPSRGSASG